MFHGFSIETSLRSQKEGGHRLVQAAFLLFCPWHIDSNHHMSVTYLNCPSSLLCSQITVKSQSELNPNLLILLHDSLLLIAMSPQRYRYPCHQQVCISEPMCIDFRLTCSNYIFLQHWLWRCLPCVCIYLHLDYRLPLETWQQFSMFLYDQILYALPQHQKVVRTRITLSYGHSCTVNSCHYFARTRNALVNRLSCKTTTNCNIDLLTRTALFNQLTCISPHYHTVLRTRNALVIRLSCKTNTTCNIILLSRTALVNRISCSR